MCTDLTDCSIENLRISPTDVTRTKVSGEANASRASALDSAHCMQEERLSSEKTYKACADPVLLTRCIVFCSEGKLPNLAEMCGKCKFATVKTSE